MDACPEGGRCNLGKDVLEAVAVEGDFYGLHDLVKEIQHLLRYNIPSMR